MVWLNDQQIGRTPTEAAFTYHGVYDVRLELSGYEPLRTEAEAKAPLYENAPIDLFAEALPTEIHNTQKWHFVLHPALETELPKDELEQGLMERAGEMRTELESTAPGADQPAEEQTRAGDADTGGGRGAD